MALLLILSALTLFGLFLALLATLNLNLFNNKPKVIIGKESPAISKNLINVILKKEKYIEVDTKTSLPEIVNSRKDAKLVFVGEQAHQDILTSAATQIINRSSIFRKCFSIQDYEKNSKKFSGQEKVVALLEESQIAIHKSDIIDLEIPLHNLTLSTYVPNFETHLDLEYYGVAIGDQLSTYENRIFIKMLLAASKLDFEEAEDIADIYSAIRRSEIKHDLALILPLSYTSCVVALDEELKALKIKPRYFFIPDLALYKNKVRAIVLDKFSQVSVKALQSGDISIGMVLLDNNEIFIQSLLKEGFGLSGLNKVIVFQYE